MPTKVFLVKAMVFPVVMYGCESLTLKKVQHQRTDAFKLWCWRRLLRVPWTAKRSNQSILNEISPEYSLENIHSLGKNTGVGCHFLLQGIFPTQGSNPGLPHCRQILYSLSHQSPHPKPHPPLYPQPSIQNGTGSSSNLGNTTTMKQAFILNFGNKISVLCFFTGVKIRDKNVHSLGF